MLDGSLGVGSAGAVHDYAPPTGGGVQESGVGGEWEGGFGVRRGSGDGQGLARVL